MSLISIPTLLEFIPKKQDIRSQCHKSRDNIMNKEKDKNVNEDKETEKNEDKNKNKNQCSDHHNHHNHNLNHHHNHKSGEVYNENTSLQDVEETIENIMNQQNKKLSSSKSTLCSSCPMDNIDIECEISNQKLDNDYFQIKNLLKDAMERKKKLEGEVSTLHKKMDDIINRYRKRHKKNEMKKLKQRERRSENPGGINKQVPITHELACFLGVDDDKLVSGTQLTSFLSKYINDHQLRDIETKKVRLDENLKNLMKDESLSLCEWKFLNDKLKHHFLTSFTNNKIGIVGSCYLSSTSCNNSNDINNSICSDDNGLNTRTISDDNHQKSLELSV